MYKFFMLFIQLGVDVSCLAVLVAICLWQYGQSDLTDHRSCVILGLLIAFTIIVGVSCGVKWGMGVYRKELEDAEKKEKGEAK